jgi:hypothetical protein
MNADLKNPAVQRLREEHGIEVSEDRLAKMAGVR